MRLLLCAFGGGGWFKGCCLINNKAVIKIVVSACRPSPCLKRQSLYSDGRRFLASVLLIELLGNPLSPTPMSLKGELVAQGTRSAVPLPLIH